MSRLLFCLFVILACRWVWRLTCAAKIAKRNAHYATPTVSSHAASEQMVRCIECGAYVPISQAQCLTQQLFRCREHAHTSTQRTATHETATQEWH